MDEYNVSYRIFFNFHYESHILLLRNLYFEKKNSKTFDQHQT